MKKLEEVHSEQAYLKELRGVDSDIDDDESLGEIETTEERKDAADSDAEAPVKTEEEKKEEAKERRKAKQELDFEDRVALDAGDAARHYFTLLKTTKQEFRALNK